MKQFVLSFLLCITAFGVMQGQEQFTVYFDFDVDVATDALGKKLSQWIANNKDVQVVKIHGFADATGNPAYNIDLSQRRAAYVKEQLERVAVSTVNAEVKGLGAEQSTGNKPKDRKVVVYYNVNPEPVNSEFTKKISTAIKGEKIRIPNLNFYNNSDIVLPESQPILTELINILKSKPNLKIDIQGHICCQKTEENKISERRAVAIYYLLVKNGIDKDRLSFKSFGSANPIHSLPEKNEEEKKANRRVEIEIIDN